jgi:site-specific DNA recombinase
VKPEEEWIIIKTPEILEKDLFEKVQQQLKKNFEQCSRNIKNKYLFAGKIWCTCGERRAGEGPMHGKHLYYRCTNRVKHYPLPRTCLRGGFNARITDEMIWKKAVVILKTPALLEKYAKQYLSEHNISGNAIDYNQKIDIESARKELAKIKDKEDRYAKGYGEGVFSIDQYKKYVDPIRREVALLESQIAKAQIVAECSNKPLLPAKEQIIALAKKAGRALQGGLNYEGKKRIVKDIISNVTGDHFGLSITGFVPINYFNYVEHQTINRNCWVA